jgi:ABC-type amino acid transport substrate-binding protein
MGATPGPAAEPLRVGITPDYPPLVFRQPEGTNGVEIDFANALGRELGRPVEFVVLRFDQLIPHLVDKEIDIIMSGMSVTKPRQLRIAFATPYVHNQIRAMFPLKNSARFKSVDDIKKTDARIGVVTGTTGEIYVKQNCPNAKMVPVTMRRDVGFFLTKGDRMDLFIDDTFALADIFSQKEGDLDYLKEPLSEEDLAWGVRSGDKEFLSKVNGIVDLWKNNGTIDKTLDKWMPYLKNMTSQGAKAK